MDTETKTLINGATYILISVEKADPVPTWLPAGNWYRYVIRQGKSDLEGYIVGSLNKVTEHAENTVADLNERSATGKYSTSRHKGKPAKPPTPVLSTKPG
jgi:hypothetical protein